MSAHPIESPLLKVEDLSVHARRGDCVEPIVQDVDLGLEAGETIGIVGESGSGKTVTARAITGLLQPGLIAHGAVRYAGLDLLALPRRDVARLRGRELSLLFQDPFTMLNPLKRCGDHVEEMLRLERGSGDHGPEVGRRLAEVGLDASEVAHRYPFQLSGGMRQRLGLAAALARDPRLLIADEATTALDVTTQHEILELLRSLQAARGMALVLITHDLRVAFSMCDRIYVLYAGSLVEVGPAAAVEAHPLHPYTLGLLLSEPRPDARVARLRAIEGAVPQAAEVAERCAFASRCMHAEPRCAAARPALVEVGAGRRSACVRIAQIHDALARQRAEPAEAGVQVRPPGDAEPLVRVEGLQKVFTFRARGKRRDTTALAGVSLEVGAHESVGLVGESGSGKTTLARCLVGLESPTSGDIEVAGFEASSYSTLASADRRRLRRAIQIVFQDPYSSLNPVRTIGATLSEALTVAGDGRAAKRAIGALLEQVGLSPAYAARKPAALSGGERQRVAIARVLALRPQVVVCDEPVSALDVSVQAQILNLLRDLQATLGLSYLFITHDLAVVRQIVDRVYVMHRGEIVEHGSTDVVLGSPAHPYTRRLIESIPTSGAAAHA